METILNVIAEAADKQNPYLGKLGSSLWTLGFYDGATYDLSATQTNGIYLQGFEAGDSWFKGIEKSLVNP